jgi:hypothetical protein
MGSALSVIRRPGGDAHQDQDHLQAETPADRKADHVRPFFDSIDPVQTSRLILSRIPQRPSAIQ